MNEISEKGVKGNSIKPGKCIYDTDGNPVQENGGSVFYENGAFYLYGENKEGVTGRAAGGNPFVWHNGVKMYSSRDFYNWKDEESKEDKMIGRATRILCEVEEKVYSKHIALALIKKAKNKAEFAAAVKSSELSADNESKTLRKHLKGL